MSAVFTENHRRKTFKKHLQRTLKSRLLGVTADLYLDAKTGVFFSPLPDGREVTCDTLAELETVVKKEIDRDYELVWERVIELTELRPNSGSSWSSGGHLKELDEPFVGFTFGRYQRALRHDGQWMEIGWDHGKPTENGSGSGRHDDMDRFYCPTLSHRYGRILPYTDVAWEGLINLQDQIRQLHQRLHGVMFRSDDLQQLTDGLAMSAAATLPLLLTDHASLASMALATPERRPREDRPVGDLTALVRSFAEWCLMDQHPEAIGQGQFGAPCHDVREGLPTLWAFVGLEGAHGKPVLILTRKDTVGEDVYGQHEDSKRNRLARERLVYSEDDVDAILRLANAGCLVTSQWNGRGGFSISLSLSIVPRTPALRTVDNQTLARRNRLPEKDPEGYAQRCNAFKFPVGWQ